MAKFWLFTIFRHNCYPIAVVSVSAGHVAVEKILDSSTSWRRYRVTNPFLDILKKKYLYHLECPPCHISHHFQRNLRQDKVLWKFQIKEDILSLESSISKTLVFLNLLSATHSASPVVLCYKLQKQSSSVYNYIVHTPHQLDKNVLATSTFFFKKRSPSREGIASRTAM